eukprot:TRINITY_DN10534_c0_g1_i2.p1 TRINITY_DN10534_c0_g1~~TRINITY_DN10534_c0_g1_i2.p1  ORF type:complete len:398 (-),score=77.10 TRINITY_DN10534_c0_g1_i2:37-1230(-)
MDTAHKTDEEKKEFFDTPEELDRKIGILAELIKHSRHFVAFTGAGISTSAGIPDYRSGVNTVLPTGAGVWEAKAKKLPPAKANFRKSMHSAVPTPCHMALCALEARGYLKFLISQNVDGLHRKSGFPPSKLAELHGNTNLEFCKKCKRKYMRDFRCRTAEKVHDHRTGRFCDDPACRGELYDSIINFGENLPEQELEDGFVNSARADLHLAMGSSLRVTPAADMPYETAKKGGKLIIVNLQATPLDKVAFMKINALIDDVMTRLVQKLDITIPPFILRRRLGASKVNVEKSGRTVETFLLRGLDSDNCPFSYLSGMDIQIEAPMRGTVSLPKEPYRLTPTQVDFMSGKIKATLKFQGHYQEPPLTIPFSLGEFKLNKERVYLMEFNTATLAWSVTAL